MTDILSNNHVNLIGKLSFLKYLLRAGSIIQG